jgi:8-oxo-dGTP pyrophosphatase MutT (NUDIX family)
MAIHDSYISKKNGFTWNISYEELDSFETITHLPVGAEGAFCFYGDKMVIVYAKKRETWEIPGGGREEGETFDECIVREIREESNMRVLELIPLGYDTFTSEQSPDVFYVLRYAARVEPLGEFSGDGAEDGEITDIKLINPNDYKNYFDWGARSDAMIEKAKRVLGV